MAAFLASHPSHPAHGPAGVFLRLFGNGMVRWWGILGKGREGKGSGNYEMIMVCVRFDVKCWKGGMVDGWYL